MEKFNRLAYNIQKEAARQRELAKRSRMFEKGDARAEVHDIIAEAFEAVLKRGT